MKIFKHGIKTWQNLHGNLSQSITDFYDLANETGGSALENYNDTTAGIQSLLREAIDSGVPVRPLGANWSLSPIAATGGILLNTKCLNSRFSISEAQIDARYAGEARKLVLAQCGMAIWELSEWLDARGLSLSAVGASNGQTIAGAIATGTHGAALNFGAVHDAVVALHLITGPDEHIWLERASYPVVGESLAAKLGARIVRDDEAFEAAVVGLGAFGFVHGVLLEAEDRFLLEGYRRRVPFDAAYRQLIETLDFSSPMMPCPGEQPFHFQTLLNPYDLTRGAYLTVMYKKPYRSGYTPPAPNGEGVGPGDDAPAFIGKLSEVLPAVVAPLVTKVAGACLSLFEKQEGTLAEIFSNTTLAGKVASAAIGLPVAEVSKVMDILIEVNKREGPFTGLLAFRFVKQSKALMAFTRFAPTCVLELDGVQSPRTYSFYEAVWNALEAASIPYTFHWGKMNSLNPARVERMYGDSLRQFAAARARFIAGPTVAAMSNEALRSWGIDGGAETRIA
jgi:hypothetical protein